MLHLAPSLSSQAAPSRVARTLPAALAFAFVTPVFLAQMACGGAAGSTTPTSPGAPETSSSTAGSTASAPAHGYVVLARGAAKADAWSLAQETYRSPRLRPRLDEAHARVFAGEDAPAGRKDLTELAETRDAVVDEGAASRRILTSLGKEYGLEGVLVVSSSEGASAASARLFTIETGRFEPLELRSETDTGWTSARATLERLAPREVTPPSASNGVAQAPANATKGGEEPKPGRSKAFYESPWFWGAAGAAAALGGAFFLATRDSSSDSIHVQMQVPR
jgi:hypothetical protein